MDFGTTLTWLGCAGVEVRDGDRTLMIDPYVYPADRASNYICITHNDYDHRHEPTLRQITARSEFEHIFVPPSSTVASKLDSPIPGVSDDLTFIDDGKLTVMYPKYTKERWRSYDGVKEVKLDGFTIETVDSSERPQRFKRDARDIFPSGAGAFVGDGSYPNLGYIIRAQGSGLSIYHPGDLAQVLDVHHELKGTIDYLLLPLPKLQGQEITLVDALRPKYVIPMHYREDENSPIPYTLTQDDVVETILDTGSPKPNASADGFARELDMMIRSHFYPTSPRPALQRFNALATAFRELGAEQIVIGVGQELVLSSRPRGDDDCRGNNG